MLTVFIGFLICISVILFAGSRLSYYGDLLAEAMGWGKLWMGMILMASVTSLPELITGVSSLRFVGEPGLAVGDVLGSCAFNILIISIMDGFYREKPITSVVQTGHIITASFGIILLTLVVFATLYPGLFGTIGWVGGYSFLFIAVYLFAIRVLFIYETRPKEGPAVAGHTAKVELSSKTILSRYIFFALLVVGAALFLPYFGDKIAEHYSLGKGFFGALFLAAATSLPEVVVSVSAVRNNSADLAVGNVLGSNLFNIFILAIDDIIYTEGPLLSNIAPTLVLPALAAIVITAIGIAGLVFKSRKKWMLAIDTFFILCVYAMMMIVMAKTASSQ